MRLPGKTWVSNTAVPFWKFLKWPRIASKVVSGLEEDWTIMESVEEEQDEEWGENETKNNKAKKQWESKTDVVGEMGVKEQFLVGSSSQVQTCP